MPDPLSRLIGRDALAWDAGHAGLAHTIVARMASDGIFLAIALVILGAWFASSGEPLRRAIETVERLVPALIAVAVAVFLARAAGDLVREPRPFVLLDRPALIAHAADYGFPSDHVIAGMALLAAAIGVRWRLAAGLVVATVGLARVAAGIHWLDDIVAAAILGLAIAWCVDAAWSAFVAPRLGFEERAIA